MTKLSIIGRDYHIEEHATGFYNTGDRVKYWADRAGRARTERSARV